jgi:hypothetical protein
MQHDIGTARITYPRTVTVSAADPGMAVALPPRLLRVPGIVSRPVRIGDDPSDFYRSASDAALKAAQVLQILDPNTPATVPGQTLPRSLTQPVTFPSWLPLVGLAFGALIVVALVSKK